jgi:hypothetical protein
MSLINENPIESPILKQAEQQLESRIAPPIQEAYARIVVAGMQTALHGDKGGILASLRDSKNPIQDCAVGAINLCLILRKKSRGTMPLNAMIPAAMTLMLHALDFADKIGVAKVGAPQLVQATHIFGSDIMKKLGITPQILQNALSKVHAVTQNPAALQKMKVAAGMQAAPGAPVAKPGMLPSGGGGMINAV